MTSTRTPPGPRRVPLSMLGRGMLGASLLAACSSDTRSPSAASEASTTEGSTSAAESLSTTSAATDPSLGSSSTEESSVGTTAVASTSGAAADDESPHPRFDLIELPDSPTNIEGCRGIDFLFVIDNSGSMYDEQVQLTNSFPGFIAAIEDSIDDVDSYHVGVITSDAYTYNEPGCRSIGDLVTQTQNGVCGPFEEGHRFATDEDNLTSVFPCMALVGASGSPIEQPVTATIAALSEAKAAPGACNEDFLRDDAILVIVIVTDDPPYSFDMDDAHPSTDTSGWFQAVLDAKDGNLEALVVIGFVPWQDVSCIFSNIESPNLVNFVQAFEEQGVLASACLPDYSPVFAETIETIHTTCTNFIPPN